jgi:hypothetical protein
MFFDLFGGGGSSAASDASDAYAQAIMAAIAEQKAARDQAREDVAPWRSAGGTALTRLGGLLNLPGYTRFDPTETLRATPGYEFSLNQGINALDRSAAAKGLLLSGAHQKGLLSYGQGLADQTYRSYLGDITGLSNTGQNAATFQGTSSMNAGSNIAGLLQSMGQNQAQGILAGYNAQQQAGGNLFSGLLGLGGLGLGMYKAGMFS